MSHYAKPLGCLFAAVMATLAIDARAQQDPGNDARRFTLSGFGTLGLMTTNTNTVAYGISALEDNGVRDKVDATFGSNLGVQGVFNLNSQFSATAQVVGQRTEDKFEPRLEWLFAKWQPVDSLSLRVGRLGAAVYAVSDFRLVNYANLWVRPPVDFYSQVPFTNINGVDVNYRREMAGGVWTGQVFFGETTVKVSGGLTLKDRKILGANLTYDTTHVTLRGSYVRGNLYWDGKDPYGPIVDGLRGASQIPGLSSLAGVADDYELKNTLSTFAAVAANVDYKNFVFIGELGKRRTDGLTIDDTTSWLLTAGYRMGKFTPYVMASGIKIDSPLSESRVPPVPALAPLRGGVNVVLDDTGTKTVGFGTRWDFRDNMALKFQAERTKATRDTMTGEFATLVQVPPGFRDSVNVYSLSLDFVF